MQGHLGISKNDNVESGAGIITSVPVLEPVTGDSEVSNRDSLAGSDIENRVCLSAVPSVDANTNPRSPGSEIFPHALKSQPGNLPSSKTSLPSEDHLKSMPCVSSIVPPFIPESIYQEHNRILEIVRAKMDSRKDNPEFTPDSDEHPIFVFAFVPASYEKD
jgi:hypothetical protein